MHEILHNLYLLSYHKVTISPDTFIVNCTKDLDMLCNDNIRIAVDDDMSPEAIQTMYMALPSIVEIIEQNLQNNKNVILHCLAGRQRSATIIAAYLIGKCGYSMQNAVDLIKSRKRDAFFSNINFEESLKSYEKIVHNT